ncbi:Transcription factor E3 [Chionoecetes opilio]|uniref:Transcription factor E3 n=1 Tax=Chionoecetes opilio TaxID=41210 RepID=A0A8J4Y5J0_CHIOP|nr:Transcription factor E3 [Chionoecetes opilio]
MDNIIEQILSLEAEVDVPSHSEGEQTRARLAQRSYSQPDCLALSSSLPPSLTWGALRPSNSYPPDLSLAMERGTSSTTKEAPLERPREQRRKESHNMFERRRRFNINERIRDLAGLLPRRSQPFSEAARQSAGHVLKGSVDYMQWLKHEVSRLSEAEARQRVLEVENHYLRSRLQQLEVKLRTLGIAAKPAPRAPQQ